MKQDLMFAGVGMIFLCVMLALTIQQWGVGPEFWWFVLGFAVFGAGCIVEAWRMA